MEASVVLVTALPNLLPPLLLFEPPGVTLGVPEPPAAADSCANPIDGGLDRKTEYTFFKNVSPTTQLGFPSPPTMVLPSERSKIAPRHCELPCVTGPRFISAMLIGHTLPPKDRVTSTLVVQGKEKKPF